MSDESDAKTPHVSVAITAAAPRNDDAAMPNVARGLAWFSVGLGIAELCAPRIVSRIAGLDARASVVRLYGLRELACGLGILSSRKPQRFLWARVAGDLLDLGATTAAVKSGPARNARRALTASAAVAGISALDVYAARATAASAVQGRAASLPTRDYSTRSGFPQAAHAMRGAALADFQMPRDMRAPDALRPYSWPAATAPKQPAAH
jgi:hypothetical protein